MSIFHPADIVRRNSQLGILPRLEHLLAGLIGPSDQVTPFDGHAGPGTSNQQATARFWQAPFYAVGLNQASLYPRPGPLRRGGDGLAIDRDRAQARHGVGPRSRDVIFPLSLHPLPIGEELSRPDPRSAVVAAPHRGDAGQFISL